MKMVKSLLLGSAAGLVAVAGAQAADLPVKAKPVEYVRICSLYGEGFFYIPGTDTCIKIGGWVRAEYIFGGGGSHSPFVSGPAGFDTEGGSADSVFRARTVLSADVRTQTEYGTLRSYARFGFDHTTNQLIGTVYAERAFIQLAGFTFGKTQSYFDFFAGVFSYGGSYAGGGSATGAAGTLLAAYTAQLGNGISATISLEDATQRRNALWDQTDAASSAVLRAGALPGPLGMSVSAATACNATLITNEAGVTAVGGCATGDYAAHSVPDIVAALRVDQAWGSAQIAGAIHQVNGNFYGSNVTNGALSATAAPVGDEWGFAIMGGLVFNLPFAKGDRLWLEATYSEGAPSYNGLALNGLYSFHNRRDGGFMAAGHALDGIFGTDPRTGIRTGIQLTEVFSIGAAIEHYWTPALRTSLFGSWNSIEYNDTASAMYCTAGANGPVTGTLVAGAGGGAGTIANCNPDYKVWAIGTRTIWNPVRNLDVGLELMYTKIDSDMGAGVFWKNAGSAQGLAAVPLAASDEGHFSGVIRLQRNFWP